MAMKPQHLLMAAMSFIFFVLAIVGITQKWYCYQHNTDSVYSYYTLWKVTTKSSIGSENSYKVDSDTFKQGTCQQFVDHFKAAEAFAILTIIFAFFAILGFAMNLMGQKPPIGIALAALTLVFGLVAWAIGAGLRNQKLCKDNSGGGIRLSDNYNFGAGWYLYLVPWCVYFICFIIAIALQATAKPDGDDGSSADEEKKEETKEEEKKEEAQNPLVADKAKEEETTETKEETKEEAKEEETFSPKEAEEEKAEEKKEEETPAAAEDKKEEETKAEEKQQEETKEEKKEETAEAEAEEEEEVSKDEEEALAKKLNEEDVERRKKIWAELRERLPTDKTNKEQRHRRFALFKEFDTDNKKYLTPEDLSHGCQSVLGLGQLKKGLAHILPQAHANAKAVHQGKGKTKKAADDQVERSEFRLVFVNIKSLFDLWFVFDKLDVANSGSITPAEFEGGLDLLKEWGKEVTDAKAEFAAIDTAGTGSISFKEFCVWASKKDSEGDEDGDDTDNDEEESQDADEAKQRNLEDVERRKAIWKDLAPRLPTNKKSKEERMRRFAYFREFDTNKNGFLTLEDVREGCDTVLGLGQLGKGLVHILPLAHNSARGVANVKGQESAQDEHVQKSEMRLLFVYIHQYFDLWFLFDTLDVANSGHISLDEFVQGMPEVEAWADCKIEDAKAEFAVADTGKTNEVTFLEFCEWAHGKNKKDE